MQFDGAFYCDKCGSELVLRSGARGFFWLVRIILVANLHKMRYAQNAKVN